MLDLKLMRIAAPLCLAIGLGACASDQEWAHPQNGLKTTQADLAQCESAARNQAWRTGTIDSFTATRYAGTGDPRAYNEPLHRTTFDPHVQEIRMRDLCMKSKGYQSVAVVNGEPQWDEQDNKPLLAGTPDDKSQLVGVHDDKPAAQ